jgi:hypothetical protein
MNKFYKNIFKNTLSTLTAVIICVLVVAGAAFAASTIGNNVSVGGTLAVTSGATFTTFASSTTALNTQGTLHVGSTSSFDGAATFLTSGTFTTFASSTTALNTQGTLHVGGNSTLDGTLTVLGETGFRELTTAITATTTLTAAQSGSTFYIAPAHQTTITLPALADGLVYKFVISGAFADADTAIASAEGDNIEGALIVAGAVIDCDAEDKINFISDGENLGDYVELRSNGTSWFIGSSGGLASVKLTCTDPS